MQPAVLLMGPTASGKTGLAMALAERLPVEIVTVDSAQVYRGMDIGTAKPSAAMRVRVPHHLLDILDPAEPYSAARFRADALRLIGEIRARGRVPLLTGGTMLYFHALEHGLSDLPPADPAVRARLEAEARERGWPAMHERLARVDPATAARLSPNDRQRIQRALEIHAISGTPASVLHAEPVAGGLAPPIVKIALCPPGRDVLHERIRLRFHEMIEQGFVDEVERLRTRGDLHRDLPSIRAVGYRQIWSHLAGECSRAAAVEKAIAATRQFAKRQLTWLRSEAQVTWLDPAAPELVDLALNCLRDDRVQAAVPPGA